MIPDGPVEYRTGRFPSYPKYTNLTPRGRRSLYLIHKNIIQSIGVSVYETC